MANVAFDGTDLTIEMSFLERVASFHGAFRIPLAHVTGVTTPEGMIFCDLSGDRNCLVIETREERFPRLAFTLDDGADPHAVAAEIRTRIGPA